MLRQLCTRATVYTAYSTEVNNFEVYISAGHFIILFLILLLGFNTVYSILTTNELAVFKINKRNAQNMLLYLIKLNDRLN